MTTPPAVVAAGDGLFRPELGGFRAPKARDRMGQNGSDV